LSGQLINAGLKPGACVAIVLTNSLEFLIIFLALARAMRGDVGDQSCFSPSLI
jgi:acyl-CoA synthetase (AMP-forming)/AMP-acid ligase II